MQPIYCYRNLRTGRWSLADKPKHKLQDVAAVSLADVSFKVYETQRLWCLANRLPSGKPYRQVHAYAIGLVVDSSQLPELARVRISYNPARGGSFYRQDTGVDILHCEYVHFNEEGAFAIGAITEASCKS